MVYQPFSGIKFQTIQVSISIVFVYKQLNVKTFPFKKIQFTKVHSLVLFDL